jgi:hypothetical protein
LYDIFIELGGETDSLSLWKEVATYKISLTELMSVTYIHGSCTMFNALEIITIAEKYGKITSISLKKEQV